MTDSPTKTDKTLATRVGLIVGVMVLVLVGMVAEGRGDEQDSHVGEHSQDEAVSPQTQCPVLIDNKIDPSIYADYKGKRVFFCRQSCKSAFAKVPENYLSRLPQFASVQADASHEGHAHANDTHEFPLISLAEPAGILTLSLVALTVCLGMLRRVRRLKPRLILKLHKIVGFSALGSGAIHATIVLLTH